MNWKSTAKTCILGSLSLTVFAFCMPAGRAHADIFSIFTSLTSTTNAIGSSIKSVDSAINQASNLEQQTVHPSSGLLNVQSFGINQIVGQYRAPLTSAFGMLNYSAATSQVSSLENSMFSSLQQFTQNPLDKFNVNGFNLSAQFHGAYQGLPTAQQVPALVIAAIDMTDAHAQDAMTQAVFGDAAAGTMLQTAQSLEGQALSTSSGSAQQIEAQGLASGLQSLALEHKMYAAQLRTAAAKLAAVGVAVKQGGITNQGIATALSGILQAK